MRPGLAGKHLKPPTRVPTFAEVSPQRGERPEVDRVQQQLRLAQFRGQLRAQRLHPVERALLGVIAAHFVFLPWALGTMRLWAQGVSLGLSLIGLVIALWPRPPAPGETAPVPHRPWMRLRTFPIFWLGLALLIFIALQGLNPAWTYETDGKNFWMQAHPPQAYLPRGVLVPFATGGAWRSLIIYGAAWMTVCSIWAGVTRRRTLQFLVIVLAVNGTLLAGFGVVQRLLDNGKLFWTLPSLNPSFFASFVYKNHAGAYLNLAFAAACGLAGWYYLRGLRRLEKSNPSAVIAFFALLIAASIFTSNARGATIVMLVFGTLCAGAFALHYYRLPRADRKPAVALVLLLIVGYFVHTGAEALRSHTAWNRMVAGLSRQDDSLAIRERATHAALEMLGDVWLPGSGAGSFKFLFPIYQHRHPELVEVNGARLVWEHAHNDVVQLPIELGAAGTLLIVLAATWWFVPLVRHRFWTHPLATCAVVIALLTVAYAWWDFPFQCPALLITWCALWPIATLWLRFEERSAPAAAPTLERAVR